MVDSSDNSSLVGNYLKEFSIDSWEPIVEALDITYQLRSQTGALVIVCAFHYECTPSLWLRQSGRFLCYGCGAEGSRARFIAEQKMLMPSELLRRLGIVDLPQTSNLDQPFVSHLDELTSLEDRRIRLVMSGGDEPF